MDTAFARTLANAGVENSFHLLNLLETIERRERDAASRAASEAVATADENLAAAMSAAEAGVHARYERAGMTLPPFDKSERVTDVPTAALMLDDYMPGWAGSVDLDDLDMYSTNACLLAQLHGGSYCAGIDALADAGYRFDHLLFDGMDGMRAKWDAEVRARL